MNHIIVRAVDSGNIQRSPTFQAVFNYKLSLVDGFPLPLRFEGAGIDVDRIMRNETPGLKKLDILDAGLHYGLMTGSDAARAGELVDAWLHGGEDDIPDMDRAAITDLYAANKTKVHTIQMNFRNEALLEAGVPERFLPGMRVPFRDHPDLGLILPVEKAVMEKVERHYMALGGGAKMPRMIVYGELAGTGPLPDELKGGMDTARNQVKYFMDTCGKAMERIAEHCGARDGEGAGENLNAGPGHSLEGERRSVRLTLKDLMKDKFAEHRVYLNNPLFRHCSNCHTDLIECEICAYKYCPKCRHQHLFDTGTIGVI